MLTQKRLKYVCAAALGSVLSLWVGTASAASPGSIAGIWAATANQTAGALVINQAASVAVCKPIRGSIFVASNAIEGFYCPVTGRLVFVRKTAAGVAFQLYEGYVARDAVIDRIGGTFKIWNAAGGGFPNEGVDFNFQATK